MSLNAVQKLRELLAKDDNGKVEIVWEPEKEYNMTPLEFCYWLQGYFDLTGENDVNGDYVTLDRHQVEKIKRHLGIVFNQPPKVKLPSQPFVHFPEIVGSC